MFSIFFLMRTTCVLFQLHLFSNIAPAPAATGGLFGSTPAPSGGLFGAPSPGKFSFSSCVNDSTLFFIDVCSTFTYNLFFALLD